MTHRQGHRDVRHVEMAIEILERVAMMVTSKMKMDAVSFVLSKLDMIVQRLSLQFVP